MRLRQYDTHLTIKQRSRAYASVAMVAALGITALLTMLTVFRQGIRSHDVQSRNQVKIDYKQKEDALLRALVAIVPIRAIQAMQQDSASNNANLSWNAIFAQAIVESNAESALSAEIYASLGNANIIMANTGNTILNAADDIAEVVAGAGTIVGPGNTLNTELLASPLVVGKLPPPLNFSGSGSYTKDQNYPIISLAKTYPATSPGLGAWTDPWNLYNIIDYPDIRFGMVTQGGKFVAKRNWWAFSLTFGANDTANSGVPVVKKNYVLSIYEVPAQAALSAGAKLLVGTFADGDAWQNTTIDGNVFGSEVVTAGNLDLGSGQISARRSITLGNGTSVNNGTAVANGFDALGAREARWAAGGSDFYGASVAADSGRVAILPLSQGEAFVRRDASSGITNTLSPTPWDKYALGARQCAMQIEILEMQSLGSSYPVTVRFHYMKNGVSVNKIYSTNLSGGWENGEWENYFDDQGDAPIPFFMEKLGQTGLPALTINLQEMANFVTDELDGDILEINNSLSIWANDSQPTVEKPPSTPEGDEMGVVLRMSKNLTAFNKGLSIVTDLRLHFAEDFNQDTLPTPAGSGIVGGGDYYPPVSVYAMQKRFGTTEDDVTSIELQGQLSSLKDDDGATVNPLDLASGVDLDQWMDKDRISANLTQIVSPAQLPPINKMTWLVTIEEIHP